MDASNLSLGGTPTSDHFFAGPTGLLLDVAQGIFMKVSLFDYSLDVVVPCGHNLIAPRMVEASGIIF